MLDGSVFKKLLKAKNAGEWLAMLERINNEHLMVKNFHSFDRMEKKVDDFLIMLEDSLPDEKFEQQQMVQNFREIFNYGFAFCFLELSSVSIICKVNSSSKYIVEYYMSMKEQCSKIWKKVYFRNNI